MEKVLIFAPHADDEIIGAGGTLLRHVARGDEVHICVVTAPDTELFEPGLRERIRGEAAASHAILGVAGTRFLDLPAVRLDTTPRHLLNQAIGSVVESLRPGIVYLPHPGDMHFDHGETFNAAMVAVRPLGGACPHTVLAYETLSETEWREPSSAHAFLPSVFVDVTPFMEAKERAFEAYASQVRPFPHPRSTRAIRALSEVRGSTIGVAHAEAFALVRHVSRT